MNTNKSNSIPFKSGIEIQRKSSTEFSSNSIPFKSGIEIHQQLDTFKLFCNCPSVLRNEKPSFEIMRKLHAVAGESGEIDVAAKYEVKSEKEFIYQGYDTTCLVELDEEPPHEINKEALRIALHIALLLHCEILPITQIMRKIVVDGSNTSGFQRTVLIARNGYLETEKGRVGIDNISLEEDSARIIEKKQGKKVFRLDRLGIPLIEIGTKPDIKTPDQVKEVALGLGDILRSCNVKRGIGTIRQDINVSIAGHPRVEIKGFQDPKMMVKTVELEIERQQNNLKNNRAVSEVRNALVDGKTEFLRPMPGASRMYPETDLPLLKISRDLINEAKKSLPKLRSDTREELKSKGLSDEMIKLLFNEGKFEEFKTLSEFNEDPNFVVKSLILIPKEIASKENITDIDKILSFDIIDSVLKAVYEQKISKSDVKFVLNEIAKGKKFEDAIKIEKTDLGEIESEIVKLVKEKPGLSVGGYMGLIMNSFKGKISGKEVNDILKKLL